MSDRREIAAPLPEKVPQPHGGALYRGGVVGHRGGSGRPPSALRAAIRESLAVRLPIAERIADDENASDSDRLRAVELLCRYGLSGSDDEHGGPARIVVEYVSTPLPGAE